MALTNSQYDAIMHEYEQSRLNNFHLLEERKAQIRKEIPAYDILSEEARSASITFLEELLANPKTEQHSYHMDAHQLTKKKQQLLLEHGYPITYLDPIYSCKVCKDTGYIGQSKCNCFKQKLIEIAHENANMHHLLKDCNFSAVSEQYFHGEDLKNFYNTFDTCRHFAETFESNYQNLLLYGTVGTGKSLLSGCIASELLKKHFTVLYSSSTTLFENLAKYNFDKNYKDSLYNMREDLYNNDLVIIDDLGTELLNSFISSELFTLLNERHLRRKATIISTNHSIKELQEKYSDRIFSRLVSNFTFRILTGPDIRITNKMNNDRK